MTWKAAVLGAFVAVTLAASAPAAAQPDYRARLPQDEVIYFLLPDRFENGDSSNDLGGISGGRLQTGFDPAHKGFFHGGDLKGLTRRLDYIQQLGATAVWLSPSCMRSLAVCCFRRLSCAGGYVSAAWV